MNPARRAFLTARPNLAAERGAPVAIGTACIARHGVACRVCGEACDLGVIRFAARLGGAALPEPDLSRCTGCGDCAAPCPVGAVSVVPRPVPR